MEFCKLIFAQIDFETANIKVAVNTEVVDMLVRKKKTVSVGEWDASLHQEIVTQLEGIFGKGEDDCLVECSIRTHRGHSTAGIPCVSAEAVVKIAPAGGGLISELAETIFNHLRDAMVDKKELVAKTGIRGDRHNVTLYVEFDTDSLIGLTVDEVLKVAQDAIEREVKKEIWRVRL